MIETSYFVIKYFSYNDKKIINLKLQKIMYLMEVCYMSIEKDADYLFNTIWLIWDYEPIQRILLGIKFMERKKKWNLLQKILRN